MVGYPGLLIILNVLRSWRANSLFPRPLLESVTMLKVLLIFTLITIATLVKLKSHLAPQLILNFSGSQYIRETDQRPVQAGLWPGGAGAGSNAESGEVHEAEGAGVSGGHSEVHGGVVQGYLRQPSLSGEHPAPVMESSPHCYISVQPQLRPQDQRDEQSQQSG